jgi:drug/metabolite transporter (DMT)-like permease
MPTSRDFLLLFLFASAFTISPFLLELQALRSISAFTVNLSYNLEPLYTILLAMLIFGEQSELNVSFWAGVFLIVLSVVLQTLRTVRHKV